MKVLNGDVGEEAAQYQAKTLVAQLQSDKAHEQYHMIQQFTRMWMWLNQSCFMRRFGLLAMTTRETK